MKHLKKLVFWGIIAGIIYCLLSYHFIFFGLNVKPLKKSKLNFNYIVFSTSSKSVESILSIDELRNDGIGQLLVKMGKISEEDLERLTDKIQENKGQGS